LEALRRFAVLVVRSVLVEQLVTVATPAMRSVTDPVIKREKMSIIVM
jgi:hypothetical protein